MHFSTLFSLFLSQAYSVYDEEIGYCQGQSFLAAVLLLHVSKIVIPVNSMHQMDVVYRQTRSDTH